MLKGLEKGLKKSDNATAKKGNGWSSAAKKDPFFGNYEIKKENWDKVYPYQFVVVNVNKGNKIVTGSRGNSTKSDFIFSHSETYGGNIFSFTNQNSSEWVFTLPITPQQLRVMDIFADNLTATARGVVEEHNGIKFKQITAQGTTGVWPKRYTIGLEGQNGALESIFSGTIKSAKNVGDSTKRLKDAINVSAANGSDIDDLTETGYYQAMLMGDFLEKYAQAKKDPSNKHWRLCFNMPKQNKTFVIKPDMFALKQDNTRPNMMFWEFKATAYGRLTINGTSSKIQVPNFLQTKGYDRAIGSLNEVNKSLSSSIGLVKSVQTDFRKPFEALRQVTVGLKSLAGVAISLANLPNAIKSDIQQSLEGGNVTLSSVSSLTSKPLSLSDASTQEEKTQIINSLMFIRSKDTEGQAANSSDSETSDLNKVKKEPEGFFGYYDSVNPDDVELTPKQEESVQDAIQEASYMNIDSINNNKSILKALHTSISNVFGVGDATYSKAYNLPSPKQTLSDFTLDDLELLQGLMKAISIMDDITSTTDLDNGNKVSSLSFVSDLANSAGIEFNLPQGKKLVPVPFGLTMEQMSARFLKDPNRWIEIATINNLRSPYIDEDGFVYNILSNAQGRQFSVDDSQSKLFIGQKITIGSSTVPSFIRTIAEIEKIGSNNFLITVDGLSDLGNLKTNDNAFMQAYLPGTTNSQNRIYIPISADPGESDNVKPIPSVERTQINKMAKVDLLLTEAGDVAINSVGDFRLATGITNLTQAIRMKLLTKKGTLLSDLEYGISSVVGNSLADVNKNTVIDEINDMISKDDRFSGLSRADVIIENNTMKLILGVELAEGNGVVPISFNIN